LPREDLLLTDIERRVALRELVGFADLGEEALASAASLSRRVQYSPRTKLAWPDQPRTHVQLLLSGDMHVVRKGRLWPHRREHRLLDLFWLARDTEPLEIRTEGGADVLELPLDALEELLEEHFSIWLATARKLALLWPSSGDLMHLHATGRDSTLRGRLSTLGDALPVARAYVDALLRVEEDATEVRFATGETIWRPGDPADHLLVLLDGSVRGAGEKGAIGWRDVLARQPRAATLEATRPTLALRVSEESFLDVLEDYHALARDLLAIMAASLIGGLESKMSG
jgi:CRP-like cAMP-binding protein